MRIVKGIVQAVSVKNVEGKKFVKFAVKIEGTWYNGISFDGKATDKNGNEIRDGYMVELHLEKNGDYENIVQKESVILVSSGEQPKQTAASTPAPQQRTVVQDSIWLTALNAACVFLAGKPDVKKEHVITLADYFVTELHKR